jgi:ornithine cyclodeaminase
MLLLGRAEIRQAVTMADAIDAARVAFVALASGEATVPPRPHLTTLESTVLVMPAASPGVDSVGVKIVSVTPGNSGRGEPVVQGIVILVDARTGQPTALIDGTCLTQLRTGAAMGLAADVLARPDAATVALFGAGATARASLWALATVRPIREVRLVHPHRSSDEPFLAAMREYLGENGPLVQPVDRPDAAVEGADVVITATSATTPLFSGAALAPGTFVGALGAYRPTDRELDVATIHRGKVVVDTRTAALHEAGDVVIPIQEGRFSADQIWAELGEILRGTRPGRTAADEIIVFKSVGNAMQDLALAARVYERARAFGLGRDVAV